MSYFAVMIEHGHGWDDSRPLREQDEWDAHAAFMDALVAEDFVILGGPLGDGEQVLLVIDAGSPAEIEERLAQDPWKAMELLRIAEIEPWEVLLRKGE